jgi:hypothetical protein
VPYRVEEHPDFLSALQGAPDELLILLVDVIYPLLATDPTGEVASPFGISYDQAAGFFTLTIWGDQGGSGFVRYQVLEDEQLVMLFDLAWLPG